MKNELSTTFCLIIFLMGSFIPMHSHGFALLSHEAVIDQSWDKSIKPLLLQKYPGSTEEQLTKAHAYVYGGAIIPDIGYYPFGSLLFTNLLHYVRSGDFINSLFDEARNLNEYAFAIGVLCHYNSDNYGHPLGTNKAVSVLFPKMKKKFGESVNYEQSPVSHTKVEFGFDVLQTAQGNYKEKEYHDFIGFQISDSVLNRAFIKTYGLKLTEIFRSLSAAIGTFRFTVKNLFPELTKDAWKIRKSFITKLNPTVDKGSYHYKSDNKKYKKEFGKVELKSSLISVVIGVLPKVGPLAGLKFKEPSEEAEKLFKQSFDSIMVHYKSSLIKAAEGNATLPNLNYDTGKNSRLGEYVLADKCEYVYLKKLEHKKFKEVNPAIRKSITDFFKSKENSKAFSKRKWKKIDEYLNKLKESDLS